MPPCPVCQQPASKRDGFDAADRQRYACRSCRRDFTDRSASAFAGYRWPAEVILLAVRWSLSHPLSATSVMELLAERGIDVSKRTVLRWVQTFGPLLAAEVRRHRRPLGSKCYVDEVFFFRGKEKRYLYRAVDETGQVVDVLFREHRDTASAAAFFRQALARTGWRPAQVISDHHQPYVRAVQEVLPEAEHVRTGLHRARGETTKPIERSHVFTRDRLRASRGVKALATGQRFFEGFEALHALRRGHACLGALVPGHDPAAAGVHERVRAVARAVTALGAWLAKAPRPARTARVTERPPRLGERHGKRLAVLARLGRQAASLPRPRQGGRPSDPKRWLDADSRHSPAPWPRLPCPGPSAGGPRAQRRPARHPSGAPGT